MATEGGSPGDPGLYQPTPETAAEQLKFTLETDFRHRLGFSVDGKFVPIDPYQIEEFAQAGTPLIDGQEIKLEDFDTRTISETYIRVKLAEVPAYAVEAAAVNQDGEARYRALIDEFDSDQAFVGQIQTVGNLKEIVNEALRLPPDLRAEFLAHTYRVVYYRLSDSERVDSWNASFTGLIDNIDLSYLSVPLSGLKTQRDYKMIRKVATLLAEGADVMEKIEKKLAVKSFSPKEGEKFDFDSIETAERYDIELEQSDNPEWVFDVVFVRNDDRGYEMPTEEDGRQVMKVIRPARVLVYYQTEEQKDRITASPAYKAFETRIQEENAIKLEQEVKAALENGIETNIYPWKVDSPYLIFTLEHNSNDLYVKFSDITKPDGQLLTEEEILERSPSSIRVIFTDVRRDGDRILTKMRIVPEEEGAQQESIVPDDAPMVGAADSARIE